MVDYDLNWLKEKGFFKQKTFEHVLGDGKVVQIDEKNSFAYLEVRNNEEAERLRKEIPPKIRYIWFYFPDPDKKSVKVFRRIGEIRWFSYNPRITRTDYIKSKMDKLSKFSPDNITILFDIRDVVSRFYDQLWRMRLKMAQGIEQIKNDKNKLLAVQRFIDRLIFFYFLAQLGLVKIKNKEADWVLDRKQTRKFFNWVCGKWDDSDLYDFLNKIFFDALGVVDASGWSKDNFEIGAEKFTVETPSLNGGLFIEEEIEGVPERKVKIGHTKELIKDILNNYNWIIGEEVPEEEDVIGDLTPEILGHIYEKFIISLEQIGIDKIKLDEIQTMKEEIRLGRQKIGAYYTPEEVTNYISMNTIYPYLTDRINEKFKTNYTKIWDELIDKSKFTREELEIIKFLYFEILTKLKICDNACGSGSFLLAAGDVLLRLYSKLIKLLKENLEDDKDVRSLIGEIEKSQDRGYWIVRQIVTNNLYGVDIMEGAIEIAKLRFWLWLISQTRAKRTVSKIEPLPNLDFNLMVGNSLIGFVEPEEIEIGEGTILTFLPDKRTKQLAFVGGKPVTEMMREIGELKKRFKLEYDFRKRKKLREEIEEKIRPLRKDLDKKLLEKFRSKGINVSEQKLLELKPFHWGFEFYEVFDLDKPKEERGFDVVIGNPPYINIKRINETEKQILPLIYKSAIGQYDYFVTFIEASKNLLKTGGRFGYIVSNKFLASEYGIGIRKILFEEVDFTKLLDVSSYQVFRGVGVYPVIVVFKKDRPKTKTPFIIGIAHEQEFTQRKWIENKIPRELFFGITNSYVLSSKITPENAPILCVLSSFPKLGKEKILCGIAKSGFSKKIKSKKQLSRDQIKHAKQIIQSEDVNRYEITYGDKWILPSVTNKEQWDDFDSKKIVIAGIGLNIRASFDVNRVALGRVYYLKEDTLKTMGIDARTLLVLLNSKLLDFYFSIVYDAVHQAGGYLRYNSPYLGNLPICVPSSTVFHDLCNLMLFLNETEERRNQEKVLIGFIDKQVIDSLVYELYFREKFEKEGLKTNLLESIKAYLEDISALKSDDEKLKAIREIVEKVRNDRKIMMQIEKIKSHPWVRVIEGKQ